MTKHNPLVIEKAKEIYLQHQGQNHRQIERAMHDLGCLTFTRRVLYNRKYKNGTKHLGWIDRFGWRDLLSEPPAGGVPAGASPSGVQVAGGVISTVKDTLTAETPRRREDNGSSSIIELDSNVSSSEHSISSSLSPASLSPRLGVSAVKTSGQPLTADRSRLTDFKEWLKRSSPNMKWHWAYQKLIYDKLQQVSDGSCKRLMIFLPPRHGKSELVTVRYSAWRLLQDPSLNIILGSYNQRLANRFSRKVRITWEDSMNEASQPDGSIREDSCSFVDDQHFEATCRGR